MLQRPGKASTRSGFLVRRRARVPRLVRQLPGALRRTSDGYETQDLELDIWVPSTGGWEWKDAELLEQRIAEGRFTSDRSRRPGPKGTASPPCSTPGALVAGRVATWTPPRGWDAPSPLEPRPHNRTDQATRGGRAILGAVRTGPLSDRPRLRQVTPSRTHPGCVRGARAPLGRVGGRAAERAGGEGASKGALGLALLFVAVGAIPSMLLIGGPPSTGSARRRSRGPAPAFAAAPTLPGLADSLPGLCWPSPRPAPHPASSTSASTRTPRGSRPTTGTRLMPLAPRPLLDRRPRRRSRGRPRKQPGRGPRTDPRSPSPSAIVADRAAARSRSRAVRARYGTAAAGAARSRPLLLIGARRRGGLHRRGRDRELERDLPRAAARRRSRPSAASARRLRRIDGRSAASSDRPRPAQRPRAARRRRASRLGRLRRRGAAPGAPSRCSASRSPAQGSR